MPVDIKPGINPIPDEPDDASERPRRILAEEHIVAVILIALALLTLANVLSRYFTNFSFAYTEEISIGFLVLMSLLGGAAAFRRNSHLSIDLLSSRLSARTARRFTLLTLTVTIALFVLLLWYGIQMTLDEFIYDMRSPGLNIPQWLYSMTFPIGCIVILVRVAQRWVNVLRSPHS